MHLGSGRASHALRGEPRRCKRRTNTPCTAMLNLLPKLARRTWIRNVLWFSRTPWEITVFLIRRLIRRGTMHSAGNKTSPSSRRSQPHSRLISSAVDRGFYGLSLSNAAQPPCVLLHHSNGLTVTFVEEVGYLCAW